MGTPTFVGVGARAQNSSSSTASVPVTATAKQAGDVHLMLSAHKRTLATMSITANASDGQGNTWNQLVNNQSLGNGAAQTAADVGDVVVCAWTKPYNASEALPTVGLSGSGLGTTTDGFSAYIITYRPATGETLSIDYIGKGSDTTSATSFAAVYDQTIALAPGDMVSSWVVTTNDAATMSARNHSASGITFSGVQGRVGGGNTAGYDHYAAIHDNVVNSGSGSPTVTASATLATASTGGGVGFRLRSAVGSLTLGPAAIPTDEALGSPQTTASTPTQNLGTEGVTSGENVPGTQGAFTDDFNRSNGPLGSNWAVSGGTPPAIGSNTVVGGSNTAQGVRWVTPATSDDQFSEATWHGVFAGVAVAMPEFSDGQTIVSSGTWYVFRYFGANSVAIMQKDAGETTATQLAFLGSTALADGDVMRLEYENYVLKAYINGVLKITHTPSSPIVGQRYVGFADYGAANEGLPIIDNWSGGTIGAVSGGPTVTHSAPSTSLAPTAVSSSEGLGSPARTSSLSMGSTSISSLESLGSPVRTSVLSVVGSGIASLQAFGTTIRTSILGLSPTPIAGVESLGSPARTSSLTVGVNGVASAQSLGSPVRTSSLSVIASSIASGQSFGSLTISLGSLEVAPTALNSAESLGSPQLEIILLTLLLTPDGVVSEEAFPQSEEVLDATNYVQNPSGETVQSTISTANGFLTMSRSTEQAWNGIYSFKTVWTAAPNASYTSQVRMSGLGLAGPRSLVAKARVWIPNTNTTPSRYGIQHRDDAEAVYFGGTTWIDFTEANPWKPGEWNELTLTVSVPEGRTLGSLYWRLGGGEAVDTDVVYWDGLQVNDVDEPYFDGNTPAVAPLDPQFVNLCTSPSVESGGGWNSWDASQYTIAADTTVFHSGTRSRKSTVAVDHTPSPILSRIAHVGRNEFSLSPVEQGKQYQYGIYVRASANGYQGRAFHVERGTIGGDLAITYGDPVPLTANVWTRVSMSVELTHPDAAGTVLSAQVETQSGADAAGGVVCWYDSAMLVEGEVLPDYFDGSFAEAVWTGTTNASSSIFKPIERYEWSGTSNFSVSHKYIRPPVGPTLENPIPSQELTTQAVTSAEQVNNVTIFGSLVSTPDMIGSSESVSSPAASHQLSTVTTSVGSAQTFGLAAISARLNLSPSPISSSQIFGVTSASARLTLSSVGVGSAQAFGVTGLNTRLVVFPLSVNSAEVFGASRTTTQLVVSPTGVISLAAVAEPDIVTQGVLGPDSTESAEAFGQPTMMIKIPLGPTSISSAQAFGVTSRTSRLVVSPPGVISAQAFGVTLTNGAVVIVASSVTSGESLGNPEVSLGVIGISPSSIASSAQLSNPHVILGMMVISPTSISSMGAFGSAETSSISILTPDPIESEETHGETYVDPELNLSTEAIESEEVFTVTEVINVPLPGLNLTPAQVLSLEQFGAHVVSYDLSTIPDIVMNASLLARNHSIVLLPANSVKKAQMQERNHRVVLLPQQH